MNSVRCVQKLLTFRASGTTSTPPWCFFRGVYHHIACRSRETTDLASLRKPRQKTHRVFDGPGLLQGGWGLGSDCVRVLGSFGYHFVEIPRYYTSPLTARYGHLEYALVLRLTLVSIQPMMTYAGAQRLKFAPNTRNRIHMQYRL